jgi:hypothetical protein
MKLKTFVRSFAQHGRQVPDSTSDTAAIVCYDNIFVGVLCVNHFFFFKIGCLSGRIQQHQIPAALHSALSDKEQVIYQKFESADPNLVRFFSLVSFLWQRRGACLICVIFCCFTGCVQKCDGQCVSNTENRGHRCGPFCANCKYQTHRRHISSFVYFALLIPICSTPFEILILILNFVFAEKFDRCHRWFS